MARLQDFQTVTPTSSDKLLVVQSQGQGLSTINAINAMINQPQLINLTFAEGVSYVSGGVWIIGKIVVVALRYTSTSAISSGNTIATGLPAPSQTGSYSSAYVRMSAISGMAGVSPSGTLVGYDTASGANIINGVYIAN